MLRAKQLAMEFKLDGTPYQPVNNLGTGAYGVVCSAVDARSDRKVAIKKIPKAFGALTLIKRTLREVQILRHFRHENIVAVLDMFQVCSHSGIPMLAEDKPRLLSGGRNVRQRRLHGHGSDGD